jgi:hypothetical protein
VGALATLAKLAYNNSIHALTRVMPFYAEKGFDPSIEANVRAIFTNRSNPHVPDAKARAE